MDNVLPSNKPRFEGRFDQETAEKLDRYIQSRGWQHRSELVKFALSKLIEGKLFEIDLGEEELAELKNVAKQNFRPLQDQIKMILIEWLENQSKCD